MVYSKEVVQIHVMYRYIFTFSIDYKYTILIFNVPSEQKLEEDTTQIHCQSEAGTHLYSRAEVPCSFRSTYMHMALKSNQNHRRIVEIKAC